MAADFEMEMGTPTDSDGSAVVYVQQPRAVAVQILHDDNIEFPQELTKWMYTGVDAAEQFIMHMLDLEPKMYAALQKYKFDFSKVLISQRSQRRRRRAFIPQASATSATRVHLSWIIALCSTTAIALANSWELRAQNATLRDKSVSPTYRSFSTTQTTICRQW